jgi:hypothetical protein
MCNLVVESPNGQLLDAFRPSIADATHILASSGESGDAIVHVRFHHQTRLRNPALAVGGGSVEARSAASLAAALRRVATIVAVPPANRTRNPMPRKSRAYCLGPNVQPKPEMRRRPNTNAVRRGGESSIQLKLVISPDQSSGLYLMTEVPRSTSVRVMERQDRSTISQGGSQSIPQNRPKRVQKRGYTCGRYP